MLCLIEIIENGARSDDSLCQMLHTEPFEVLRFKMFEKSVFGSFRREDPVVQFEDEIMRTERALELRLQSVTDQYLFR